MKKVLLLMVFAALLFGCTKTVEKIVYPNGELGATTGAIVGLVKQADSNAKIVVRQAVAIDSTTIDASTGQFRIDNLPVGNYDLYIKAPSYGARWLRNVMVHPGGVTYVGEVSLARVPDLVESFYPADQSEVVFDQRWSQLSISISFSQAMNRASVEQAFSTDPPSEGLFFWGYYALIPTPTYFWNDAAWADKGRSDPGAIITSFSKVKAFTYRMAHKDCFTDTTYTIKLSTAAMDSAGNHLEFPLEFKFSTVQSATTQSTILTRPEHGDIWVDPLENSSITMTFPRRMNQSSVESGLNMTPATNAIYVWPSGNELRIYTGGPLHCDTRYQIALPATVLDLDGVPLGEPFDFAFDTAPFQVERSYPQNGEIFVSRNARISIQFNTYITLSSAKAAITITPGVNGSFIRGYENGQGQPKDVITFIPSASMLPNTKYTVTVNQNAVDLHGTALKEAYSFAFVTEPE